MFDTSKFVQNKDWCRERFVYEPEYGAFLWATRPLSHFKDYRSWLSWNSKNAGSKMGYEHKGYTYVRIDGEQHLLHRLAFLYTAGYTVLDGYEVDHINGIRDDNRLVNLRVVSRSENQRNTEVRSTNTSGVEGVF